MSTYQFWHEDMRLLEVYQKAYFRNVSYNNWLQGAYNFEAFSKATINANRSKKSDPIQQYEQWKDPFEKAKPKITSENLETEFRKQQVEQQAWLFNR